VVSCLQVSESKTFKYLFCVPYVPHARLVHCSWFYQPYNIWWAVQATCYIVLSTSLFKPSIFLSTLLSNSFSLRSSLIVTKLHIHTKHFSSTYSVLYRSLTTAVPHKFEAPLHFHLPCFSWTADSVIPLSSFVCEHDSCEQITRHVCYTASNCWHLASYAFVAREACIIYCIFYRVCYRLYFLPRFVVIYCKISEKTTM
jgi:hypothetical protein